jgi:hypothetical protein
MRCTNSVFFARFGDYASRGMVLHVLSKVELTSAHYETLVTCL